MSRCCLEGNPLSAVKNTEHVYGDVWFIPLRPSLRACSRRRCPAHFPACVQLTPPRGYSGSSFVSHRCMHASSAVGRITSTFSRLCWASPVCAWRVS